MKTSNLLYLLPGLALLAVLPPSGTEQPALANEKLDPSPTRHGTSTAVLGSLSTLPPPDAHQWDGGYSSIGYRDLQPHAGHAERPDVLLFEWGDNGYRPWQDPGRMRLVFPPVEADRTLYSAVEREHSLYAPVTEPMDTLLHGNVVTSGTTYARFLAYQRACLGPERLREDADERETAMHGNAAMEEQGTRYGVYATPSGAPLHSGNEPTLRNWLLSKDCIPWDDPGILLPETAPLTEDERAQLLMELDGALRLQHDLADTTATLDPPDE